MKKSQYNLIYDLEKDEKLIYNTRTLGLSILEDEEFDVYKTIELHHSKTKLISDLYRNAHLFKKKHVNQPPASISSISFVFNSFTMHSSSLIGTISFFIYNSSLSKL